MMSLDVYLKTGEVRPRAGGEKIYIRRGGQNVCISREEWDVRFPGREPCVVRCDDAQVARLNDDGDDDGEVFHANITHNLNKMADAAGIYEALWRPEEVGISTAAQLIGPLTAGLVLLRSDPERFKVLNPPNGWGNYDILVEFVAGYLQACIKEPEALVRVSR
jgi:hypothetical protein